MSGHDYHWKQKFIRELIDTVWTEITEKVINMPENWDGIELRQFVADSFKRQAPWPERLRKRLSDYRNEVLVRNL